MIAEVNTSPRQRIIQALHPARLQPYLDAALGNEKNALSLYVWHIELTAAVHSILGVTEVIVRNAMDAALQTWNNEQTGRTESWLLVDPESPLKSLSAGKRKSALTRTVQDFAARDPQHARHGVAICHDDVLAHIMFGLWKDLLPNHQPGAGNALENVNRKRLWDESLRVAFKIDDPDGSVTFWRIAHLHQLRNRVSHMEPLLNLQIKDLINDAFALIRSIDESAADWATGISKVSAVLNQRPTF